MIRPPAVAGRFYSQDPVCLGEEVDSLLSTPAPHTETRSIACMVPHAGYTYSGRVAGAVYRRLRIPSQVILIGPRHYPRGAAFAILTGGSWQTPLGLAAMDDDLGMKILRSCPILLEDVVAHAAEHSLEVQLPFLQRRAPGFTFVPIVIGPARFADLDELGRAIASVILGHGAPVLLIASSDMNHYESNEITRLKDRKAIDRILALDPAGLFDTVRKEDISMCGYAAAVVTLVAARQLGASKAELAAYATSGEVNGQMNEVVGYAGMIIS
jgi:AmmeMemoRadiSam system protein B